MTAAYRLKGTGWLITTVAIALGFYLVSLRVAEERKRLEAVNGRIASAQRDIRALETEFDTRANLVQLERWNGDTLALAAPTAGQFVRDASQLAMIDPSGAASARVKTAALVVPSIAPPAALPSSPLPSLAVAPPAPAQHRDVQVAAVAPPLDPAVRSAVVRTAVVHAAPSPASDRTLARLANAERAGEALAKVRPQAIAMLDNKLLSDATLGDLIAKAKREARGTR